MQSPAPLSHFILRIRTLAIKIRAGGGTAKHELRVLAGSRDNSCGVQVISHPHRIAAFSVALVLACSRFSSAQAAESERQQAIALEQQGRADEAEAAWRSWVTAHPADAEAFAHLGLLESRQEHFADAIRDYRKAMALAPNMPALRPNLGLAYFKNGDYRQAIDTFAPLLKAHPEDDRITLLTGMSHYGLGEYAAAAPYLKRSAEHDPQNLTLLLTLAHTCLFAHEYPCVLDTFHKLVALNAESAEADMLVGEALDEMKDPVGAQREFRAAIAVDPKEPNVHFGLGYLLWTKGQYGEAAQEFQSELDNDPQHLQAMLYLADSDIQIQKEEQAAPLLQKLIKLMPNNAMAHRDLGVVEADSGSNEEAVAQFQQAIRLAPGDVNAHYRLARLYRAMGRTAQAKVEFDKSRALNKAADERLLKVMSAIPAAKSAGTSSAPSGSTPQK
jgi:Flp pilus assembly protein TadD